MITAPKVQYRVYNKSLHKSKSHNVIFVSFWICANLPPLPFTHLAITALGVAYCDSPILRWGLSAAPSNILFRAELFLVFCKTAFGIWCSLTRSYIMSAVIIQFSYSSASHFYSCLKTKMMLTKINMFSQVFLSTEHKNKHIISNTQNPQRTISS